MVSFRCSTLKMEPVSFYVFLCCEEYVFCIAVFRAMGVSRVAGAMWSANVWRLAV